MARKYTQQELIAKYQKLSPEKKVALFEELIGFGKERMGDAVIILMLGYEFSSYENNIMKYVSKRKRKENA